LETKRRSHLGPIAITALCFFAASVGHVLADPSATEHMKRRPQGILTGMPFMANVASRTFVDDLGRKIYLAKEPQRIVSLAPSVTETLYAIGAGDRVVGVTEFCDYPPDARSKPKVAYSNPNLETIVALKPDLVLAPRDFIRPDILAKLEQLKIAAFVVDAKRLDDIPTEMQTIGRILGRSDEANRVALEIRRHILEVKAKTERLPRLRVLYVLNTEPLISVGPGSFIHELIEIAGGQNVAAGASTPYPRLSIEAVLKEDPQLIIFPHGSTEGIPQGERDLWKRWVGMSAVKASAFHQVPSDVLNRPGPRVVEGLDALAAIIHPELSGSARAANPAP